MKTAEIGVFGQRDFRLLWIGETVSGVGNAMATVALPLIAVAVLHASAMGVGALAALVWLPWLVVGLPAGAWVDRLPRRPILLACNAVSIVGYASVPVSAWIGALTYPQLVLVALVAGVPAVFFSTAYHAYLPTVLAAEDLLEGNSRLQVSETASQVAGPSLAGLLAQAFGAVSALLVNAATFVVSTVCLLLIGVREAPVRRTGERPALGRQVVEGLRFVVHDRYLRPMVSYAALVNFALMGYQAVQVVFLVRTVGAGSFAVGLLVASGSAGGVVGALAVPFVGRRLGTARGLVLAQLIGGPFALLLPLTTPGPGLAFFAAGAFMVGAGITICNVMLSSFRQAYCPPRLLGRVVATTMVLNHSTIPLGALLGGLLAAQLGTRPAMWIMTAVLTPCGLILALSPLGKRRDLPAPARSSPVEPLPH